MAAAAAPSPAVVGRRILGEVEETSLEDVLQRIRAEANAKPQHGFPGDSVTATTAEMATQHGGAYPGRPTTSGTATAESPLKHTATPSRRLPNFPVPALQHLVARHFRATRAPELVVGGYRPLALVYLLVATLVAAPRCQTVIVVDTEARFDVRQLLGVQPTTVVEAVSATAVATVGGSKGEEEEVETLGSPVTEDDLQHVHVFRVDPRWRAPLAELVAAAEQRVLYGAQRRRDRPWWGTIVVGGAGGASSAGVVGNTSAGVDSSNTLSHGACAALVTGSYGWLRVDSLERGAYEVQQKRQRRLLALFEDVDLNQSDEDVDRAEPGNELPPEEASLEPVTWAASSPWGSFRFQLSKTASLQGHEIEDEAVSST